MPGTIFMIHGMWGSSWCWDNYRRVFEAQGYQCIATTLRHHGPEGRSAADPRVGTLSLLDYVADLEQELNELDEVPIIFGHSMGGLLAQMLGARGQARALVLLTPASPAGIVALTPSVVRSFWSVQSRWGFWKKPMRQRFGEAVYSMLHLMPEPQRKEIYEKFVFESGRAAAEIGYWLVDPRGASKVEAINVRCPVLVVAGAQDRITPASVVRRVARKYASVSTYMEFPNHAHWIMGEPGWQMVAEEVADWLSASGALAARTDS